MHIKLLSGRGISLIFLILSNGVFSIFELLLFVLLSRIGILAKKVSKIGIYDKNFLNCLSLFSFLILFTALPFVFNQYSFFEFLDFFTINSYFFNLFYKTIVLFYLYEFYFCLIKSNQKYKKFFFIFIF